MTATNTLTATPRTVIGKASKRLAHANQIPAVLYGVGHDTVAIAVSRHDFELWATQHGGTGMVEIALEGEKKPIPAMVREVQHSSVKGTIMHVDFLAVAMNKPVHATVAVHLVNDPEGVKAGGVLTVNLHEVNIEALPKDLPEFIEVDVSALQIGDSLHVGDIVAPKGVSVLDDAEQIVASVQAPRVEEAVVSEEAAEPEVVGKPSAEEE